MRRRLRPLLTRRRLLWTGVLLGLVLVALAHPPAGAQSGGDVFQSTGPPSQVGGDTLANRYPMSHYALDLHIDKIDISAAPDIPDVPKLMLFGLTDLIWQVTAFGMWLAIQLFTFAFSLDLLNGSSATNGQGALEPVSDAVHNIYNSTFGEPFLVLAIICAGLWGVKTALAQRRYSETIAAFTTSLVFAVIALWFVTNPQGSVGFISDKSNELSAAFLSISSSGEVVGQERAKNSATDQLFEAHVFNPWLVLNFGGTRHCVTQESFERAQTVDKDEIDDTLVSTNAYPPNGPDEKGRARRCYDNAKYAGSYLFYSQGDDDRSGSGDDNSSYNAINNGDDEKWPENLPADYKVPLNQGDAIAVSMQEGSGVTQRLGTAVVVFIANLGAIILIGALSIAVILAQILALLLLLFAPAALVLGIFPGRGHDFFRNWLIKLLTALFRKAIYSFVLAVLLAAAAALQEASTNLGWLMSFGLQATFYWMVFLYRKQILAAFTAATTSGQADEGGASKAAAAYYKGRMAMGSARAAWQAPAALATAAANAGRTVRDDFRADKRNVQSIRDWVQRKRTGGGGEDTPRADDREEGGDGRLLDWSSEDDRKPIAPVPAGGRDGEDAASNGRGEAATVTPPTAGQRAPGGEDPDLARRSDGRGAGAVQPPTAGQRPPGGQDPESGEHPGRDGREGRPGRAGGTVAGPAGPPGPPGSAPGGPPRGGEGDPGRAPGVRAGRPPERGGQQPPAPPPPSSPEPRQPAPSRPPSAPQQPRPAAPAGGQQRPGGGGGGGGRSDAAVREVDQRITELQGKRGRSAAEKQELDRLREWRRKAGGRPS